MIETGTILAVAAGGAAGSVARYLTMSIVGRWLGSGFPWGTMAVNIVGSLVIGMLVELSAARWSPGPELRAGIIVGVLGGFTTFSTFTLDLALMVERNALFNAAGYAAASVFLGLAAFQGGLHVMRHLVPAAGV